MMGPISAKGREFQFVAKQGVLQSEFAEFESVEINGAIKTVSSEMQLNDDVRR